MNIIRHRRTFQTWMIFLKELHQIPRGEWWVNTRPDDIREKELRYHNLLEKLNQHLPTNQFSENILSLYFIDMLDMGSNLMKIPPRPPLKPPNNNQCIIEYETLCFEMANDKESEYGYYALDYCFPHEIHNWTLWEILHLRKNMMNEMDDRILLIITRTIIYFILTIYREMIRSANCDPYTNEPLLSDLNAFEWKDYSDIWYYPTEHNKRLTKELLDFAQSHPEIIKSHKIELLQPVKEKEKEKKEEEISKENSKKHGKITFKKSPITNKIQLDTFINKRREEFQLKIIKYLQHPGIYKDYELAKQIWKEFKINISSTKPTVLLYVLENLIPLRKIRIALTLTPPFQHMFFEGFIH